MIVLRNPKMNSSNVHELGLASLVYVSRSSLVLEGDADAVKEIVSSSISRNGPAGLTGAMIYTELYFAQVLEGPSRAIDELMNRIRRDKRHHDVTVVAEQRIPTRKFEDWAMGYWGPAPYLDRHLKPLISPATSKAERSRLVERLMTFMQPPHSESTLLV